MKNLFNFNIRSIVLGKARWLLTFIAILTLGVGQMWASKRVWIDVTSAPSGYTDKMIVQYYVGSSWTSVWAQSYGTIGGKTIYYADIADNATKWQVYRGDNLTHGNDYNWQTEQTYATNNKYTVTGWNNSGSGSKVIGMVKGGYMLFDNSQTQWSESYRYFVIGHDSYYGNVGGNAASTLVANTKLWSIDNNSAAWPDAKYFAFISHTGEYPSASKAWSDIDTYATHKTSQYTSSYSLDKDQIYLCVPTSGTGKPTFTITWKDGYSALNNTVTIRAKISTDNGSNYSDANTPGALSASAYKFTAWNSCGSTTGTSASLSAGSSTATFTAGYTANTSVEAANADGYTFTGWYEGSTKILSTRTGTMNPHGAVTLYAYYKANRYTVSFDNQVTLNNSPTVSVTATYGVAMPSITTLPTCDYYTFGGYYSEEAGAGTIYYNGSGVSQRSWDVANDETLYAKWTQTVTLNSNTDHGGKSGGNGSAGVIFNGGKTSYTAAQASSASYLLEGYYTGATSGDKVIDASGNIVSNVTDWTDADGNWIHEGASTLYAHWKTTCTLSYDGNGKTGGSVTASSEKTIGSEVTAAEQGDMVRTGYTFTGWNTAANGLGSSISAGTTFTINNNMTLYAQWTENTVTLTPTTSYTGASSTHSITGGGTIGITTTVTLTADAAGAGYIWNGWSLSSNLVITSGSTSSLTITVRTDGDGEAVSAVAQYTEDLSSPLVLKGGSIFGGTAWSTEHALEKKTGFSGESVAYFTIDLSTTNTGAANSNYQFKIFKGSTAYGLTGSGQYYYERTTGEQELSSTGINIELRADKVGLYEIKVDYSSTTYKITITFPGKAIVGTFNSWNSEANPLVDGVATVANLSAETDYQFKVFDGGIWYGNNGKMTSTNKEDWEFTGGGNNCTLHTTTAGDYIFGWNTTTKRLTVIFPGEQSKMKLEAQQYIYFNSDGLTAWNAADYTARFYIKNYASGEDMQHVDCVSDSKLEGKIYYAQLPNDDDIGQIQINRIASATYYANKVYAYKRANTGQNCLVKETGKENWENNWTPQWSTYCPPISTASMSPTSTTWGGDGSSETPYLVPISSTINVSAAFTQPLNDTKMTQMYQFKVGASNDGAEAATNTHSYTAASTATKTGYSVVVRNNYNSTNGTAATSSPVYFETRASYTITYNKGTNGSGSVASGIKLNGIDYTLSSLGFSRDSYLQIGWSTSDGGDKAYEMGGTYTGDANLTLYPYWILKDYTVTLNPENGGDNVEITATYNSSMPTTKLGGGTLTAPTYAGYSFGGYFTEQNGGGTQYYDEEMASARNWDIAAATTLYAYWIPNTLTFNGNVSGHETEWNNTGNWSEARVPTINHPVVIDKPVVINTTGAAKAKSVVIYNDGNTHTGKLEIPDGKALIVAETIQKTSDGETMGATAEADIVTGSSLTNGNGVLIMGTYTGGNEATVGFVTKSHGAKGANTSVNQFIGTPFAVDGQTIILYNYYNSWMCKVDYTGSPAWALMSSDEKMNPFEGYNLISADEDKGYGIYYALYGKLVTSANQTLTLKGTSGTENLLANSWMGPIVISKFQSTDFVNADAVIYIFNAGSPSQMSGDPISSAANNNSSPGQYTSIPINLVSFYTGYKTIPSMQAFSIMTNGSSASLTLDYKRLVYDPAVESVQIEPNHAPSRTIEANNAPEMMNLYVSGESGYSDRVWMVVREDFSDDYENGWEARKIFGADEAPQFYAMSQAGQMAIDAVAQIEGTVLAFRKGTQDSNYTFSFNYDGEDVWYLNDLQEQQSTLINANNTYTFMSAADDNVARFIISATPINQTPTATDQITLQTEAKKMLIDGTLYIIRNGRMYSAEGQIVK